MKGTGGSRLPVVLSTVVYPMFHAQEFGVVLGTIMPYLKSFNGAAGGSFTVYAAFGGINPLTCTIFDPIIFGSSRKKPVFHISPTRPKWLHMGNYLGTFLKMAHRDNTGSHRGKRMLLCVSVKLICGYFSLFSIFALWHNGNLPSNRLWSTKIFESCKNDLQSLFFRVNITHHESKFFYFVACILQEHP